MSDAAVLSLRPGERVLARDRAWRIAGVQTVAQGRSVVQLLPADGDALKPLSVVVPPEDICPLPSEDLRFDLSLFSPFGPWRRAHEALNLTAISEEGLLSGARFGRVSLEAYQVAPVLRILAKPRPRLLIADDVGLGKTIEAGLCMLELMARRRADRIVIAVPPGLLDQWHDELLEKFGLQFMLIENAAGLARAQTALPAGLTPWEMLPRVLTSIDYLKKEDVRARALRRPWDLIVVDEAHALAESGTPQNPYRTQRTRFGSDLRGLIPDLVTGSRGLLLLTATPHNGYSHAFRSLLELVEPTAATFAGAVERTRDRVDRAMIRRMKTQIVRRNPTGQWVPAFLRRKVEPIAVSVSDPEQALFGKVLAYCSRTARDAEGTEDADLVSFAMQIVKKRMLSSRLALTNTLENRIKALKQEAARETPPEPIEIRDLQADLPLSEQAAERIAQRIIRSAIPKDEKRRKSEIRKLNEIRKLLHNLPGPDPKITALIVYLREVFAEEPQEKVIVFTEYLDTLEAIRQALDASTTLTGRYTELRGGWTRSRRTSAQDRFESPDIRVLLATDAASEGLNLQRACRRVVHFELPWNPNRLEQRNGRVDRYSQNRKPEIRYLYFRNSPEDSVLNALIRKIEEMQGDRVSTIDYLGTIFGRGAGRGRRRQLADRETDREFDRLCRLYERAEGHCVAAADVRERLARPLLRDILGYHLGAGEDGVHGLYPSAETEARGERPISLGYIGGWAEDLDTAPAKGRRPGATLLSQALARAGVRYGVLVTGSRLRLLRRPGDGPRGACLELDIPGCLEDADRESFAAAFRIFGAARFIPRDDSSLPIDEDERESREHAQKVSDDLKRAIFQAAESLIQGLLDDWVSRADKDQARDPTLLNDTELVVFRDAALTTLYRLLFILYAEARDERLHAHALYRESYTLQTLVEELLACEPERLPANRFSLWPRLLALFRIFDEGLPAITLPPMNYEHIPPHGSDFFRPTTAPRQRIEAARLDDRTAGRLLLELTTTVPRQGVGRERISFRELDIEQLGAVYAGLLEFEPRIAGETVLELRVQGRTYALTHHVRCGNSLLGTWLERLGDPPLPGIGRPMDPRQLGLFVEPVKAAIQEAARKRLLIDHAADEGAIQPESLDELGYKEDRRREAEETLAAARLLFDLRSASAFGLGEIWGEFHTILSFTSDPEKLKTYCRARPWWTRFEEVRNRERFFHWELEYPEVLFDGNPGFDAVLGNPPWDKVLPTKHEFYAHYDALIRAYKGNDLERRLCRCRGADGGADYEHSQKKGS